MGSQVGTKDCVGWTVLHHAVHSQNVRAIEAAIGALPALVTSENAYRNTPLHTAAHSGTPEIVRAALESVVYQTRDLFEAMAADGTTPVSVRVDGGMAANDWTMQFLSDLLSLRVERPLNTETTVLGAAYLSALGAGLYDSLDDVAAHWRINKTFSPTMAETDRDRLYAGWLKAVAQTQGR